MYAKLHKYEDVEKAAFEAISRHVKYILEGTRLKTLIKDHPEEVANLMVNINKKMQQKLNFLQHPISMHGGGGGAYDLPSGLKRDEDCPPGMVRGPNGQLWPAWVFCTRYSDRPSSGKYILPEPAAAADRA